MSRFSLILSCLALLVISPFFLFGTPAQAISRAPAATCPFQYDQRSGEVCLDVMIDGKGPFSMKLDTGSTMSLITPKVARLVGIKTLARTYSCGAYGANVSFGSGTMVDVQVGTVSLYEQPCLIGELNNAIPCEGILSGDIFDKYAIQLNFANRTATFYENGRYSPAVGDISIPIQLGGDHVPVCDGSIDNMPVRLAIDTGFDGSLTLLPDFVKANHLADRYHKVATATTYSLEGIRGVGLYAMNDLEVGSGSESRRLRSIFAFFDDFDDSGVQYDYDGLLGTRMLSHWTVTFDYANSRIVFH